MRGLEKVLAGQPPPRYCLPPQLFIPLLPSQPPREHGQVFNPSMSQIQGNLATSGAEV